MEIDGWEKGKEEKKRKREWETNGRQKKRNNGDKHGMLNKFFFYDYLASLETR